MEFDFNRAVGYKDNYIIQGFNVLTPEQSAAVFKAFDLESEIFVKEISEEEYERAIAKLHALGETDSEIIATRRLEQGYLKKHLFGKKTIGNCAGCKEAYPVSFLVAAHIKKRSFCDTGERKDLHVVMPMCKLGCDEVYEKGYICVSDGIYTDMKKYPCSEHLQEYINLIAGTKCEYYDDKTEKYFDWHFSHNK